MYVYCISGRGGLVEGRGAWMSGMNGGDRSGGDRSGWDDDGHHADCILVYLRWLPNTTGSSFLFQWYHCLQPACFKIGLD